MWNLVFAIAGSLLLNEVLKPKKSKNKTRRIFISHSWSHGSNEYQKFIQKLEDNDIEYFDHSIPPYKRVDADTRKELREIFRSKMQNCSKIFVLAAAGTSSDSFVSDELEIAMEMDKEIIAVKPHGQYRVPAFISDAADKIISNNATSIINSLNE